MNHTAAREGAENDRWFGLPRPLGYLFVVLALVAGIVVVGVGSSVPKGAGAATTTGTCNYSPGTGGGLQANYQTLCWIDMSGYDDTLAAAPGGQAMSISIGGGYTATFTLTDQAADGRTARVVEPASMYGNSATGTATNEEFTGAYGYGNTAGEPRLYTESAASAADPLGGNQLTVNNFEITDSSGTQVHGYALVGMDSETTDSTTHSPLGEGLDWQSDQPITELTSLPEGPGTGCPDPPPGIGTDSVTCQGSVAGGSALVLQTINATTFSQTLEEGGPNEREAVAFAIETAKITLNKTVASRSAASDSFDLSVTTPEGTTPARRRLVPRTRPRPAS